MDIVELAAAGEALELLDRADADDLLAVIRNPNRDWVTPEAVPGEAPVARVLQPVMEALFLDEAGDPAGGLVELDKALLDVGDLDEPAVEAAVDKGRLTAPAEGIAMLHGAIGEEAALSLQVLNNHLVSILDVLASVGGDDGRELAVLVDGDGCLAGLNDAAGNARGVIVLTEAGGAVHDTRTRVLGHEGGAQHLEAAVGGPALEEVEEWLVALAHKGLALELLQDGVALDLALLEDVVEAALHADVDLLRRVVLPAHVVERRVDSESEVAGQGPRRGRPSNEVGLLPVLKHGERDDNGGGGHLLIVGTGLEVGQHGVAGGGERHDLGATVDEVLIEDLLEGPPDALHVIAVHSLVVVLEVDPAAEAAHRLLPLLRVAHDDLAAELVVAAHADLLALHTRLDLVDLVDFELDGQSVAIPAKAALHVVAFHSGIPRHNILDGAGGDVAVVRQSSSEGGAIVEGEFRLALAELELLLEGINLLPVGEHVLFLGGEVRLVGNCEKV
mmetsp:Transcript_26727/g.33313  ORF Transcript_26727/g.33313 Transcript_26727/m.33313 type:complete len:503 (-) Transcript_26727:26-1534(-)